LYWFWCIFFVLIQHHIGPPLLLLFTVLLFCTALYVFVRVRVLVRGQTSLPAGLGTIVLFRTGERMLIHHPRAWTRLGRFFPVRCARQYVKAYGNIYVYTCIKIYACACACTREHGYTLKWISFPPSLSLSLSLSASLFHSSVSYPPPPLSHTFFGMCVCVYACV